MKKIENRLLWIEAIVNSSDDAIISKDLNNIIVSWNKGAENLYGYKEEEVIGKPISIIIPEDKKNDIQSTAVQIENREYIHHLETVRITKDGRRLDVSVSVSPIIDNNGVLIGSSAIARDITERKRHEEILQRSEDRYRKMVELSPDTIIIYQENKIIFINQAGLKLLAAENYEQIIGKSIWSIFTPDRHGIIRSHNQIMLTSGKAITNIEHATVRLDGKVINVETSFCLIDYDEKPAIYLLMRDISERKKTKTYLEMQYTVAKCLNEATNMIDGISEVLRAVCHTLKFEVGKIWIINNKNNSLNCITTWSNHENFNPQNDMLNEKNSLNIGEGPAGIAWKTEQFSVIDLTKSLNSKTNQTMNHSITSDFKMGIAVPIYNSGEILGIMEFLSTYSYEIEKVMQDTLTNISRQCGVFLKKHLIINNAVYSNKHDTQTGLSNRAFFEETLSFELYRAKSKNIRLAVLLLDIDSFSSLNEAMGHEFGDQVLLKISQALVEMVENSDNIARFSGDQFAIIVNDFTNIQELLLIVNRIKEFGAERLYVEDQKVNVQLNIGISLYPEDGDTMPILLKNASVALSKAKKTAHGAVQFCTSEMSNRAKRKIFLENDLRNALTKQEFMLYYQPLVDTEAHTVMGLEALIRWRKDGSIISPAEFIPIIEETHLIIPIGAWIIETACKQCKTWQQTLQQNLNVSVNISAVQFQNSSILDTINEALQKSQLDPETLKIEITESMIMNDAQGTIKTLQQIKELGVKIAIDDFGTGYSSLSYLRQLPIDYIKIDRSFITHIIENPNDSSIVRTIIGLANNLGYSVIAEGVETQEQMEYLKALGCHIIQGYYYSQPLPTEETSTFLLQNKQIY